MPEPAVILDRVAKQYPDGTRAVRDVSLEVRRGELLALVGTSGCGKTTLLKMINRLIEPTSGSIRIAGRDGRNWDPIELRRSIGYVIQEVGLMPHLTVAQNVALVPRLKGWPAAARAGRAQELLALVGLAPERYAGLYPGQLSGGQRQRVGVARALAADPDIVLMDEPFGALDPITRRELQDEFRRLHAELHKTVVLVTHDLAEAVRLADRMALMDHGALVQLGPPRDFWTRPATGFVRRFLESSSPDWGREGPP